MSYRLTVFSLYQNNEKQSIRETVVMNCHNGGTACFWKSHCVPTHSSRDKFFSWNAKKRISIGSRRKRILKFQFLDKNYLRSDKIRYIEIHVFQVARYNVWFFLQSTDTFMIFVIIRLVDISTEQILSYSKDKTNLVQIKRGK